jgi:hypothetical protein
MPWPLSMRKINLIPFLFVPLAVNAQSPLLLRNAETRYVSVEYLRPDWEGIEWYSGAWFLGFRTQINPSVALYADLPFYYVGFDNLPGSSSGIANPYIGLDFRRPDRSLSFELGVRPGIASSENAGGVLVVGLADFERYEAFVPPLTTVLGMMHASTRSRTGVLSTFRVGFVHQRFDSDLGDTNDNEIAYGFGLTYAPRSTTFGLAINGRWQLEAGTRGLADATIHQIGFAFRTALAGVQPGLSLRVPLDDGLRRRSSWTLGVSVLAPLN